MAHLGRVYPDLYSYGLYCYGLYSHGLRSYGLYSYGLYSSSRTSLSRPYAVMAYIVVAYTVMAYIVTAYIARLGRVYQVLIKLWPIQLWLASNGCIQGRGFCAFYSIGGGVEGVMGTSLPTVLPTTLPPTTAPTAERRLVHCGGSIVLDAAAGSLTSGDAPYASGILLTSSITPPKYLKHVCHSCLACVHTRMCVRT